MMRLPESKEFEMDVSSVDLLNNGFSNTVLAIVVIYIGIVIIRSGMKDVVNSKLSKEWPTTDGVITRSEPLHMVTNKKGDPLYPLVSMQYTYSVDGQSYSSSRIFFVKNMLGLNVFGNYTQNILSKYPAGKTVKVTYQPSDPQNAALESGLTKISYIKLPIGWLVLNFGIFSLIVRGG